MMKADLKNAGNPLKQENNQILIDLGLLILLYLNEKNCYARSHQN